MAEYTLYGMAQSGNAYKPALMLQLSRADWEPRWVDFFNGETRSGKYRAEVNEMGEVPVLEHRGMKLSQSGVILDYLAGTLGTFGPRDEAERREILRWLLWDNHKLTSYTATYRFMRTFAKETPTAVAEAFWARAKTALGILDKHLASRDWVAAPRPTIADLSVCGYLFFEDEIGVSWAKDYPGIARWLGRIRGLPGWKHPYELLPGHPLPGKTG